MLHRLTPAHVIVAVGAVLLVSPALVPVQQFRIHNTQPSAFGDPAELEREGYRIVAYENLSERGQELYRQTLRNGGRYTVPIGQGAPDFDYSTRERDTEGEPESVRRRPPGFVVKRPLDTDLPRADEPAEAVDREREREGERREARGTANGSGNRSTPSYEQRRRMILRYDLMVTTTDTPPLTSSGTLLRLLGVLAGVVCVGVGGYRVSKP